MEHKVGDKITYETPLSGGGKYEAEILEVPPPYFSIRAYRVKILKIICPSRNPIAPQKVGDIDHVILATLKETKMRNPHPKMITDEVSGIEVENQRHIDWKAGAEAEKESIIKLIKKNYIPGRDAQLLLKDIQK